MRPKDEFGSLSVNLIAVYFLSFLTNLHCFHLGE